MAEWLKATDCKSVHSRVRRFEPYSAHGSLKFQVYNANLKFNCGSSSFGRAVAFQASGGQFEPGLPLRMVYGLWLFHSIQPQTVNVYLLSRPL